MIHILDDIQLMPEQLSTVLFALAHEYLPHCSARGVQLEHRWVSPPVVLAPEQPLHLWLLWQVPDIASYYGMRAGQDERVVAFWQYIDSLSLQRARHVMGEATAHLPPPLPLPQPEASHAA